MSFDTLALCLGALMAVPGILFMIRFKTLVSQIFVTNPAFSALKAEQAIGKEFNLYAALASYYLFLLGATVFTIGMYHLAMALSIPPALTAASVLPGMLTVLLYMGIMGQSITGIPGVYGPPVPARVVMGVIGIVLLTNLVMHLFDGDIDGTTWVKVFLILISSVGVPHALAFKARSEGWDKFEGIAMV